MSDDPPPNTRPTWKAETIVEPNAKVSGSTSVLCWACASVNGSVLTWVTATFADADVAETSRPPTTTAGSRVAVSILRESGMARSPSPVRCGSEAGSGVAAAGHDDCRSSHSDRVP